MEHYKILKIDDSSFECKSIIEFTSLIKILFKLSERQKYLENQIELINNRVDDKEKRLNNIEIKVEGESKSEDLKIIQAFQYSPKTIEKKSSEKEKFEPHSSENSLDDKEEEDEKKEEKEDFKEEGKKEGKKRKEKEKEKEKEEEKEKEDEKDEKKSIIEKGKKEEIKKEEKKIIEKGEKEKEESEKKEEKGESEGDSIGNINADMIRRLFKKVKDNEKKITDLIKKSLEHKHLDNKINNNHEVINANTKKIDGLQQKLNELTTKFSELKDDYEDIKVKVQDFNIYDLIKGGEGAGGDVDLTKSLIMNLENKIFKKFSFYDERNKNYDKEIFNLKEESKNANNLIDNVKINTEKNGQEISDLNSKNEKLISQLNERIESLENELNKIQSKNDEASSKENISKELVNEMLKEFEEKIKDLIKKEFDNKELNFQKNENEKNLRDILKGEQESNKNNIKRFNELEKMLRQAINENKTLSERVQILETENLKKFSNKEGLDLKNKLLVLEEEIKDESLKIDVMQQAWEKMRSDISNLVKKIEFLNQEYSKLSFQKIITSPERSDVSYDLLKYLEKEEFNDNKKEVNKKFEKVRLAIENLGTNLENILNTISHTVSDKELINYQGVIKNIIDELKLSISRKYAEKSETNKTFKYLETQLKTVMDAASKKMDGSDNWLLAKKPLNNYLCASCESIIKGELEQRSEYIPWNKYPTREDKTYRMGHGFSRMLQMVNDDIMKSTNADNINNNLLFNTSNNNNNNINNFNIINQKDSQKEEDIINYSNSQIMKLPKVKNKNMNIQNLNLNKIELTLQKDRAREDSHSNRIPTSPYDDTSLTPSSLNVPQIMKIYKLNKNSTLSSTNIKSANPNSVNAAFHQLTLSQKKMKRNDDLANKLIDNIKKSES